jgi:elongation factor 1 alpha-like protein
MVIVGHVDAGKSTLLGHLLVLLGDVEERVLLRYERDSRVAGKPSFHFAWILDQSEQERARGITVEVATRHIETPHRRVTVLDAPGHRDFVPNMIGGAAQADACLLVVPATRGEFETAFAPSGQTREHAILAKSLGVDQAVLVVNKMDAVQWSQERFDEVVGQVIPFLRSVGFKEKALCAVPVSAFAGENLVRRQEPLLAAWYSGPTLLEAIDAFSPPARLVARPLRFSVSAVVSATSSALTLSGRVESGSVMAGERVLLMPQRELVTVKSLLRRQDVAKVLRAGEVADIVLKGVPDGLALAPGMCICDSAHPTPLVLVFRARILTLDIKLPLLPGLYTFFSQGVSEGCVVTRLLSKFKRGTQEEERRHPRHIPRHAGALVEVELQRPLCLELNAEYRGLGRFALRRGAETVCVGVVTELVRML